jgi:predicted dehydrogenase
VPQLFGWVVIERILGPEEKDSMKRKIKQLTRREFIVGSALGLAGCATARTAKPRIRYTSPNEKLNVAAIGAGGKGGGDIGACASENVVALCDVDDKNAAGSFERWPNAKRYRDYRVMLEKQKDIEAVTIGTPDHTHAPAALMAMELGIHVYVEKPLTHTVEEARILREAARRYGVVTQMGNQGHSYDDVRRVCETIWIGLLGDIREVHAWTNRPVWPQNIDRPAEEQEVPAHLDWDLWIGTAPWRPYHAGTYHTFNWRGWWDFGCGALGDMGCHVMDPVFWAMNLIEAPSFSVEVVDKEGGNEETGPAWSIIRYKFPERKFMPPVTVTWYDGGKKPACPEGVKPDHLSGGSGSLFIGSEGILLAGEYGSNPTLLPEEEMGDFTWPDPIIPRVEGGPEQEWIRACKGGPLPGSYFEYSAPFTEMVLLGNVALRVREKIEWDVRRMKCTNRPEANQYISKEYREGWGLPRIRGVDWL